MRKQIVIRVNEEIKIQLDEYCDKYCVMQNKLLTKIIEKFLNDAKHDSLSFVRLLDNTNDKG